MDKLYSFGDYSEQVWTDRKYTCKIFDKHGGKLKYLRKDIYENGKWTCVEKNL